MPVTLREEISAGEISTMRIGFLSLPLSGHLNPMTALARKTGLSRETLYRTLSKRGNPRLDTLAAILAAFGLRLTVRTRSGRAARGRATVAPA